MILAFVIYTVALAIMVYYYIGRYEICFLQFNFCWKEENLFCFWIILIFFSVYLGLSIWGSRIHTLQQLQFLNAFNHLLSYLMLKKLTAPDIIFGAFENPFSFGTIVYRKSLSLLFNVVECKVVSTATFFLSWNNTEISGRERESLEKLQKL